MRGKEGERPAALSGILILCGLLLLVGDPLLGEQKKVHGRATKPDSEIRAVLEEQAEAWNRGDVESFMKGYWRSEQLVFAGSGGVNRGWQAVLERYKKNYPNRKAMGKLTFSDLEITLLGKDAAVVLGRWQLEREKDRPGGVFTLVLRKFSDGWRIIHDHTSGTTP